MKWKSYISKIFVVIMVLLVCSSTSFAQKNIQEEQDYIKGRPLTEEEIQEQESHVPQLHDLSIPVEDIVRPSQKSTLSNERATTIPSNSYDSRALGLVTSVKDQGNWGACWAFSAMSAIETAAIKSGLTDNSVDYSEQHLAYFYYNRVADPLLNTIGDVNIATDSSTEHFYLDVGGNSAMTAHALSGWMGPAAEATAPYFAYSNPATPDDGVAYTNEAIVKNSYLLSNDNITIKNAIMNYGSVSIMYGHDNTFYNYDTAAFYSPNDEVNHLVTIVGWDDDYSRDNFNLSTRPVSNGAWLVKNSWSEAWGDNGIFYLSYENESIVNILAYEVEAAENFDHNYYYDGTAGLESNYIENNGSISNVYEVKGNTSAGDETLNRVQFSLYSPDVSYRIQVYKGLTDASDPTSGTEALSTPVEGTTGELGTYNIDLNQTITLPHGMLYSVVITLSGPDGWVGYATERDTDYGWVSFDAQTEEGQSFRKRSSSSSWVDLDTEGECARIKAYTNDVNTVSVQSISLNTMSQSITVGGTASLIATLLPEELSATKVEWTSSDTSIASVSSGGVITGEMVGTAEITATVCDNAALQATSIITVTEMETPTLTTKSAGYNSIKLNWNKISGATGYEIYQATEKAGNYSRIKTITSGDTLTYKKSSLTTGKTYYYKVRAYRTTSDGNAYSSYSSVKSTKPVLVTPALSTKSAGYNRIKISWNKISGATGYKIYRATRKAGTYSRIKTITSGATLTYKNSSLSTGKTYYYKVRAYRTTKEGSTYSAYSSVKSTKPVPAKVSIKSIGNKTPKKLKLTWGKIAGASGYQIYRATKSSGKYSKIKTITKGTTVSDTNSRLTKGKKYFYKVRAYRTLKSGKKVYGPFSAVKYRKVK